MMKVRYVGSNDACGDIGIKDRLRSKYSMFTLIYSIEEKKIYK